MSYLRYAEILLNAAEALNEVKGPEAAYDYVNQVRARVGMPAYKGMTKEQLRERIRNERRIELAFEDHRFFDERRWKLFDGKTSASEKNEPRYKQVYNIYSVVVTPDESQVYTYRNDNTHPTRAFSTPKNYYFPVPDDTYKKNLTWVRMRAGNSLMLLRRTRLLKGVRQKKQQQTSNLCQ